MEHDRLGPYEIAAVLGTGGMGVVYRARHAGTGAEVALKVARVRPDARDALALEIDALSRLRHPGIVRIVDHGVDRGELWVATELVHGTPLRERMSASRRASSAPPPETLAMDDLPTMEELAPPAARARWTADALRDALLPVQRLCAALAWLHGEGHVHGDVKPDNVLVRPDGTVVLVDFGLHRAVAPGGREVLHATQRVSGTAPYLSPEQGRGRAPDARSDSYAVGCVLYELLGGRLPFGPTGHAARRKVDPVAQPLSDLAEVPEALERLVHGLLEGEPRRRTGYAADVVEALAPFTGEEDEPPGRVALHRPALVGRREALEQLAGAPVALVVGATGAGKTRLLSAVTEGSREVPVIGADAARPIAATLLRALAARCPDAETAGRWFGEGTDALVEILPALARVEGVPPVTAGPVARAATVRAVVQALVAAAPLQVVIDDAHLAGPLDREILVALARRRADGLRVAIAVSDGEGIGDLAAAGAVVVRLGPLDDDALDALLGEALAVDRLPDEIHAFVRERAGGNPRFAWEYASLLLAEGRLVRTRGRWTVVARDGLAELPVPAGLVELAERRWASLGGSERAAAVRAAVAGTQALAPEEAATLARARVLERGAGGWFLGPAFAALAVEAASPEEVARLHAEAQALFPPDAPASERARHLGGAGRFAEARAAWREAVRDAEQRAAWGDVMQISRAVLALPGGTPEEELTARVDLAALRIRGRWGEAAAEVDRALAVGGTGFQVRRARVQRARARVRTGAHAEALAELRAVVGEAVGDERLDALEALAESLSEAGELPASVEVRTEIVRLREAGSEGMLARSRVALANVLQRQERTAEAHALLALATPVLRAVGPPVWLAHALATAAVLAQSRDDQRAAEVAAVEALAIYRRVGLLASEAQVLGILVSALRAQGRWSECEARLVEAEALAAEIGSERLQAHLQYQGVLLAIARGAVDGVPRLLACAERLRAASHYGSEGMARYEAARHLRRRGAWAEAAALLPRVREIGLLRDDVGFLVGEACEQGHHALARGEDGRAELARAEALAAGSAEGAVVFGEWMEELRAAVSAGPPRE